VQVPSLTELFDSLSAGQAAPPWVVVVLTGLVALAVVALRRVWQVARNTITIAHEGGHALVALLARRRLTGIRLHSDTSGVTLSRGRPRGPGMVATAAAGYTAPSLLGLAFAALLSAGYLTLLLWLSVALLAAMLIMIRNLYGVLSVLATGAVLFVVSWFGTAPVQGAFGYLLAWFLLLGGVRPVIELQRLRRQGRAPTSDADQLAWLTRVPGLLWVAVFGLVAVASLVAGGALLLRPLLT
jgi:hypothetical protein